MSDAFIRLARPEDDVAIHAAHTRSIREVCVKDHGEEEIRGWGYRELGNRWVLPIQRQEVWVVELNGIIQGVGYIQILDKNGMIRPCIHALYLTPELLGKKFGARLLTLMLEKAKSCGATGVELNSSITAHEFYKSFGFIDSAPVTRINFGGYPVTSYPMRLDFEQ
jgi:putative acetyltransferase